MKPGTPLPLLLESTALGSPVPSVLKIDPPAGLVLQPAFSLATSTSLVTTPTKTSYETALDSCPKDSAILSYEITLETPSGLKVVARSGPSGLMLDGFIDPANILAGLSMEQLRRMLVDYVAEPFLRRTNLQLNKLTPTDDPENNDHPFTGPPGHPAE